MMRSTGIRYANLDPIACRDSKGSQDHIVAKQREDNPKERIGITKPRRS